VDRGRRAAPGEALQLKVAARIEEVEEFRRHGRLDDLNGRWLITRRGAVESEDAAY
jgi:hypothetical protein